MCNDCPNICAEIVDSKDVIYHFLYPNKPSLLKVLNEPNGASLEKILEDIDFALNLSGEGPLSSVETNAINFKLDGLNNRHITPILKLSGQPDNLAQLVNDGLYIPFPNNLYTVKVSAEQPPYFLEEALIGGTDGVVDLSFILTNNVLLGLLSINIRNAVQKIISNPGLVNNLTSGILNSIITNSSVATALTDAVTNQMLHDSLFISSLTDAIASTPEALGLICDALKGCLPGASGSTCADPTITYASASNNYNGTINLIIGYTAPSPSPINGYDIHYRVAGSSGTYTVVIGVKGNPLVVSNLTGNNYEGFIVANCGNGNYGNSIPFTTNNYFNVYITNSLPNVSITGVSNIAGYTFSGPVNPGGVAKGVHTAFNAAITVNATGTPIANGNLALYKNGVLIQCINIPAGSSPSNAFNIQNFGPSDFIDISYNQGSC